MISLLKSNFGLLLASLGKTLQMTLIALVTAILLGLFFALLSVSHKKYLRFLGGLYVWFFRGVPLLVLLFFVYFGGKQALEQMGCTWDLGALGAGGVALALNCGASLAEIFQAGIKSIDSGQMEVARSLGMSYPRAMYRVILPQVFLAAYPSIVRQFIATIKDTSLLAAIGFSELTFLGKNMAESSSRPLETWALIAVFYLAVILVFVAIGKYVEGKMKHGLARACFHE